MKIGFIGAGQMAQALAKGFLRGDKSLSITASDVNSAARKQFQRQVPDARTVVDNLEVYSDSDLVFLAVKPQVVDAVFAQGPFPQSDTTLVSIVAGISLEKLMQLSGNKRCLRVMPNTPALVCQGALAIARNSNVPSEIYETTIALLKRVGTVVEVDEWQLDAVTGLSGSGPAYVLEFLEGLIDGGVKCGLPRPVARELAMQTLTGTIEMLREVGRHPAELRDQVTSPAGTTSHGLHELHAHGFRSSVIAAVESATRRAVELGNQ
ncbi:MAG: pyrroline-5-carboxylate reductase [Pirellulaceae bacterium]|nr:pyrroline-5-carboxylate reductase [Pirellulaceae bacterium]